MLRALAVAALSAALAAPAAAQTADEIVAKCIEARGGIDAIKAVRSVRMTGRIRVGESEMPIVVEIKRGAGLRTEITFPDARAVQAFDGRRAWGIAPGSTQPELLPEEAGKQMAQQANFEGALVDYRAKGHRVELAGSEKGASGTLHRLRVTLEGGDVDQYLIDGESWLTVRVESKRGPAGDRVETETAIGSYAEAGGWKWPRLLENSVKGRTEKQTIRFDKVDVNPLIDDSRFKLPANARPASGRNPAR